MANRHRRNTSTQSRNRSQSVPSVVAYLTQPHPVMAPLLVMASQDSDSMSASSEPDVLDADALLGKFHQMLQSELVVTAKRITDDLTKQIQDLGARTDMVEIITVRDLPETITDLRLDLTELFLGLLPDISKDRLEFDRIHRALQGSPQGRYYTTQVEILRAAREQGSLDFRIHSYKLYPELSPTTLQKRRTMQPFTKILQHHKVRYRWAFPFHLAFSYNNRSYTMDTPEEGLATLAKLNLVGQHPSTPQTSPPRKLTPIWQMMGPVRPKPVAMRASQWET
ncbi:hypothetical protein XELAEV_18005933mg [Xenopus laevis]|uniref:Uncharacterized protein n=1 Tax=Xenopus laevis TaxID=8355 RepID=A0A974E062_XENLA|nr:hypothetical protein XELAEV_18005933mg [Xenopus laevis]